MGRKIFVAESEVVEQERLREQCIATETVNYEDALGLTGHGKFNRIVLSACAFGLLAVGFQNGLTAYLMLSIKCDLQITSQQIGYINVAFMIGGIVSACLWGVLADMFGRRLILLVTFIADSIITLVSATSQNFSMFVLMRFLNGFFIGGPGCLVFTYLGDTIVMKRRTKYICYIGFCFIFSWIFLPILAFLLRPIPSKLFSTIGIKIGSWRLYLLSSTIPSIVSTFLYFQLPESPRFLLENDYKKGAIIILSKIFTTNTGEPAKEYLERYLSLSREKDKLVLKENTRNPVNIKTGRMGQLLRDALRQTSAIFKKPHKWKMFIIMFIFFVNMFGCYGFGLWIPELLTRFRKYNNINTNNVTTVCQLVKTSDSSNSWDNKTNSKLKTYDDEYSDANIQDVECESEMDYEAFIDTLTIGIACLLYNILSVLITDYVNSKILSAVSLAIAGNAAATFLWANSSSYCLMTASVFQGAMITGNIVIVGLVMDAFPPHISSMAVCVATLAGRVGSICSNLFFGAFMDVSCQIPVFLAAALSIGGALLVMFVNTNDYDERSENQDKEDTSIKMVTLSQKDNNGAIDASIVSTYI